MLKELKNPVFQRSFGNYTIEVCVQAGVMSHVCRSTYTSNVRSIKELEDIYTKTNEAMGCLKLVESWVKSYNRGDMALKQLLRKLEEFL